MEYTTKQIDNTIETILGFTEKQPTDNVITWLVYRQFRELCGDYQLKPQTSEEYDIKTGQILPIEYDPVGKRTYWGERFYTPILNVLSHYNVNIRTKANQSPVVHMKTALDRQSIQDKDSTDKYKSVNTYTHEVQEDTQAIMDDNKLQRERAVFENNRVGFPKFMECELAMLACFKLFFNYEYMHWTKQKELEERTKKLADDRRSANQYVMALQKKLTEISNAASSLKTADEKKANSAEFTMVAKMLEDAKADSAKMGEVIDAEVVS